jgi:hypothetical protein
MTPRDPEALQVAFIVLDILRRFGIPYHLGGSFASAVHGIPRHTQDVDLVVDLAPGREHDLARALAPQFYVDEQAIARAIAERSSFNAIHLPTGVKVDLFVKGASAFDEGEFERSIVARLGDESPREVRVKSAEDTVLRKLLWFRLGGEVSDRQWQDVRGIVAVQAERLDVGYLRRWAGQLGILELLERALFER